MATPFAKAWFAINEENAPELNVQEYVHLTAANWDWANTSTDGHDFLPTLRPLGSMVPYAGTALQYSIVPGTWDSTAKSAWIFIKLPTWALGVTQLLFSGGDLSRVAASSWDNAMQQYPSDPDCIASFHFTEGSGGVVNSSIGSWPSITNAQWGAGDPNLFGDNNYAAAFSTGGYLKFRAASSHYLAIPDLLSTYVPPQGAMTWLMRVPSTLSTVVPASQVFVGCRKFGTNNMFGQFNPAGPNRVSWVTNGNNATQGNLSDIPPAFGPTANGSLGDNIWKHNALTWGNDGTHYYINGIRQVSDEKMIYPWKTSTQDTTTQPGVAATVMGWGCFYDPRPGNSANFANFDLACLSVWSRQLKKVDLDQNRHRMQIHPIKVPFNRLNRRGVILPANLAASYNNTFQEAYTRPNPTNTAQLVTMVRAGSDPSGPGTRIVLMDSKTGLDVLNALAGPRVILGMGTGGEANLATGASWQQDPISGKYVMIYTRGVGALFQDLYYADSTNFTTWTSRGQVQLPAGFLTNHSIGNSSFRTIDGGVTWELYLETMPAGLAWQTFKLTSTAGYGGPYSIVSGPLPGIAANPTGSSSGPEISTFDGKDHLLLHSDAPSIIYHRYTVAGGTAWFSSPYDHLVTIRSAEILDFTNSSVTQNADGTMPDEITLANGDVTTILQGDILPGANPSAIGGWEFKGTRAQLFRNSVRFDTTVGNFPATYLIDADTGPTPGSRVTDYLQAYKSDQTGPLDGVTIRVYLTTDYNAGNRSSSYVQGLTTTGIVNGVSGRMPVPMYVTPGNQYTIEYNEPGLYQTSTVTIQT